MRGRRPCALPAQVYASRWMEAQAEEKGPPPLSVGFTYELTAGIVDKSKSLAEIAKEEVCSPAYVSNGAAPRSISYERVTTTSNSLQLAHLESGPTAIQRHSQGSQRAPTNTRAGWLCPRAVAQQP